MAIVKDSADFVTLTNDEDGVAATLALLGNAAPTLP
jgi:hydroxymethylpyrimidine pyrophosphatase-like HAD family hydrolase